MNHILEPGKQQIMATSEARIEASRRNGALSKGPVTEEGKSISRKNSLKHGLTGAGVVLPEDDAAEVQRRTVAYGQETNVSGEIGIALARRAALSSVRMERSAQLQSTAMTQRVRQIQDEFEVPEGVDDAEATRMLAREITRAMLEPSKEMVLARRYEAAAERAFFRSLKELEQLKKKAKVETEVSVNEMLGSILAMRNEDREMEAYFAEMEKTLPPEPVDSPYSAPTKGRVDVPISAAKRR